MVVPDLPDPIFVKAFVELIKARVKQGRRFAVVVGGGKTCRNYQNALAQVRDISNEENDWMGIYTTHFNAQLVRLAFGKLAKKKIATSYDSKIPFTKSVLVGAGAEPGHSTDYDAVLLAQMFNSKNIVNVSNIDYVYTADPRKNPDAKPLPKLSWDEYLALVPKEWVAGFNSPFDVTAAGLAKESGITVSIVNGGKMEEVAKAIDGNSFEGSAIGA